MGNKIECKKILFRRSLMYVPGNDERKINKIPQLAAAGGIYIIFTL